MSEKINEPLNIIRKDKEVSAVAYDAQAFDPSVQHMLRVVNINNTFYLELEAQDTVQNEPQPANHQNMYVVVRGLKEEKKRVDYEVKEKDILKLGRVKYAVKEIGRHTKEPADPMPYSEKGPSANSIFSQNVNDEQFEEI